MPNFNHGKVYLLVNDATKLMYVGSTTMNVRDRFHRHRSNYNQHVKGNYRYCTSFALLAEQPEHVHVVLLEACSCESKRELLAREAVWIERMQKHVGLVNKCRFTSYSSNLNISSPITQSTLLEQPAS